MATEKAKAFLATSKVALDDSVETLPGIGPANKSKLAQRKITKVGQLLGFLMVLGLNRQEFMELLEFADVDAKNAKVVTDALIEKAMQFCTHDTPETKTAVGDQTASVATFLGNKLSTCKLKEGYVPGLGEKSCASLHERGCKSVVELMGAFLLSDRDPDEFKQLLIERGGVTPAVLTAKKTDLYMVEYTKKFAKVSQ